MQDLVISEQLISILHAVILGAVFALLYDAVRIIRQLVCNDMTVYEIKRLSFVERIPTLSVKASSSERFKLIIANVFDVLYSLIISVVFCIFLYAESSGIFRWYLLFGTVSGFLLYRLSFGRFLNIPSSYVVYFFRKFVLFILFLLFYPIKLLKRSIIALIRPVKDKINHALLRKKTDKVCVEICRNVKFDIEV